MKTKRRNKETYHGTGGNVQCTHFGSPTLVYVEWRGLKPFNFWLRTADCRRAGAQECANKGRIHVATYHRKSPSCFSKERRKEKPHWARAVPGPMRCQHVSQQPSPWHSQCLGGNRTGGQMCSGWRNGLTGKKQIQPFGMLSWLLFIYLCNSSH